MKIIIALACLLALAYANEDANVLKNIADVGIDRYNYELELDNSNKQQQEGQVQGESLSVHGEYSHDTPEGEHVHVKYIADENGYQVVDANPPLPTPHPIPEHILRSLEWIRAHPSKEA